MNFIELKDEDSCSFQSFDENVLETERESLDKPEFVNTTTPLLESNLSPNPRSSEEPKKMLKVLPNIVHQWTPLQPLPCPNIQPTTFNNMAQTHTPQAYSYKDRYQKRKEDALKKKMEEEKKMREFHSRPMPNFRAAHERLASKVSIHSVTVPITPEVLKRSKRLAFERSHDQMEE